MQLTTNKAIQVNYDQYIFARVECAGLMAHRKDEEGNYFIKPLCYLGSKEKIEKVLESLS